MKKMVRITCVIVVATVICLSVLPCLGADRASEPEKQKMTVNDPQFIPLSDEQVISKPVKWYWYALGIGVLAGAMGGGGSGGSDGPSDGTVVVGW